VERLNACGPYGRTTLFRNQDDYDKYDDFKNKQDEIDREYQI